MFRRHPILTVFTLAYLAVVGWVTLGPQPFDESDDGWIWRLLALFSHHELTDWITYDRLEFMMNVAMFIPVGLFFLLLFGRRQWWLGMLLGFVLTCVIESAQFFIPGRVSDVRDIVSNSVGAIVGVLVALVLTAPKARRLKLAAQAGRAHA